MKRSDFSYSLPDELIARYPLARRSDSRLLCLDGGSGRLEHRRFSELPALLRRGDLLVLNNTRVIPARLWCQKSSGGGVEVLVERILGERECVAQARASKAPRPGAWLWLRAGPCAPRTGSRLRVLGREGDFFRLGSEGGEALPELLRRHGRMPLPPYIGRADEALDRERYQTVYGEREGAVAAPTAGLHFDEALLAACRARGVAVAKLTLHVGAGTFQPVRAERIEEHRMHAEHLEVSAALCEQVRRTRAEGGRVVAVGTTVVRALETAARSGELRPYRGDSRLFIYPGHRFRVADAMLTNFHLPESTLIMLVSAFAGRERVLRAYRQAVARRYRFFSYGDAMFLLPGRRSE